MVSRLRRILWCDGEWEESLRLGPTGDGSQAGAAQKISAFNAAQQTAPPCDAPDWQREPLRITFHTAGKDAISYDFVPGSAVLVEDSADDDETPAAAASAAAQ